jgi:hypothetical protein
MISEGLSHGQPDRCCNIPMNSLTSKKANKKRTLMQSPFTPIKVCGTEKFARLAGLDVF